MRLERVLEQANKTQRGQVETLTFDQGWIVEESGISGGVVYLSLSRYGTLRNVAVTEDGRVIELENWQAGVR